MGFRSTSPPLPFFFNLLVIKEVAGTQLCAGAALNKSSPHGPLMQVTTSTGQGACETSEISLKMLSVPPTSYQYVIFIAFRNSCHVKENIIFSRLLYCSDRLINTHFSYQT